MLFQPGQSGNPAGRPRGQRSRVWIIRAAILGACRELGDEAEAKSGLRGFIRELVRDVRRVEPGTLLRVLRSLLPKEVDIGLREATAAEFAEQLREQLEAMDAVTMPGFSRVPSEPGGNGGDGNDGGNGTG